MANNFATIWWSVPGTLENMSGTGAGVLSLYYGKGGITGVRALGNLFFIFQEKAYNVYQYATGNTPLQYLNTVQIGCNFDRTIVEINNYLYYLADNGDLRRTNGSNDVVVSSRIRTITHAILNDRTISDYFGDEPNTVPHAVYDHYLNAYRLYYAGSSSYVDKCLTYFIDSDIFTTSTGQNFLTSIDTQGFEGYPITLGNSAGTGITSRYYTNYSNGSLVGTLDLGWLSSGTPKKQIKIENIELWYHAQPGVSTPTGDCDTTITINVYNNPETNALVDTHVVDLDYNSTIDNLQKKRIQIPGATGEYVRIVITDSGSNANYSLDKVILDYDQLDSVR